MESAVTKTKTDPNLAVVQDTLDALTRLDPDAVLANFADEVVWVSPPLPVMRGKNTVERGVRLLTRVVRAYAYRDATYAVDDDRVFNERVEELSFGPFTVELPVSSVVELRAGKIVAWRDYYDSATFLLNLLRARSAQR